MRAAAGCAFSSAPAQADPEAASADLLQRSEGPEAFGAPDRQVGPVRLDRDPGFARGHRPLEGRDRPGAERDGQDAAAAVSPFRDVPMSVTLDDLTQLTEDVIPKVNAV